MTDLLQLEFFRNGLFMCILLGFLFGTLSFFVVMQRMTFLSAGVAHSAFGGVALGILIGVHPFFTSLVFCVAVSMIIGRMAHHGTATYDTGTGIFFSFSMALGVIFIALKNAYTFDLSGYLFGNILGVQITDLWLTLGLSLIYIPFMLLYLPKILFMTFDREVAAVSGLSVKTLEMTLLVFLAAVIVVSLKIVGIILVSALAVLPASFGLLFSNQYRQVIAISIIFALCILLGGLFLSYHIDTPTGATIVVSGTLLYFAAVIIKRLPSYHK